VKAGASLLGRARELHGERAPVELLLAYAEAQRATGELDAAEAAVEQALAVADDDRLEAHARLDALLLRSFVDPDFRTSELLEAARGALEVLERAGDDHGLSKAWRGIAEVHLTACRWTDSAEALERATTHARRAGDDHELMLALPLLANALYWGPTAVAEGIDRCAAILDEAAGHKIVEANILCYLGGFEAMRGNFDGAWQSVGRARAIFEELGHMYGLGAHTLLSGSVALLEGDGAAAERELRAGCELFESMGETGTLASLAPLLAEALLLQGRIEEAEAATRTSEEASSEDDIAAHIAWRVARAKIAAYRGAVEDAEGLAREAVALAADTDFLNMQGDALSALADVLRDADARREALERYERKGNVVSAARTRDASPVA
jgi:tetratricopeptide (TPR) repeat protein